MGGEQLELFGGEAGGTPGLTIEQEARNMGWKAQEEFDGAPEAWVSAEEFVDRGKHILPILSQNNKRLQGELASRDAKIANLEKAFRESQESIQALQEHYSESTKRAVQQAKQEVIAQLKAAKESGDVDNEIALTEELQNLNAAQKDAEAPAKGAKKEDAQPTPKLDPETTVWMQENPWFGVDRERTENIMRIGTALRVSGNTMGPKDFGAEVLRIEQLQKTIASGTPASKVSGVSNNAAAGGSSKGFASLPAEAKKECHSFASKVVGPNRVYKTLKEWEAQYAKDYFGES